MCDKDMYIAMVRKSTLSYHGVAVIKTVIPLDGKRLAKYCLELIY